jgi:hypothetical protein
MEEVLDVRMHITRQFGFRFRSNKNLISLCHLDSLADSVSPHGDSAMAIRVRVSQLHSGHQDSTW